jgi:histidyl-tRNA synthetase
LGRDIPATGGSFGFERIMEVMKERGMLSEENTKTQVMVAIFDQSLVDAGLKLADQFRRTGLNCFLYSEDKPMQKQLSYANKKGIKFVAILGDNEIAENKMMLKDMLSGEQNMLNFDEAINKIK